MDIEIMNKSKKSIETNKIVPLGLWAKGMKQNYHDLIIKWKSKSYYILLNLTAADKKTFSPLPPSPHLKNKTYRLLLSFFTLFSPRQIN